MYSLLRAGVLAACLALAFPVAAQADRLVPHSEFYFDSDAGTIAPIIAQPGSGDAVVDRLARAVSRNPRDVRATAQLARVAMEGGRPELGRELYDRALGQMGIRDSLGRPLRWNYGWDLYRSGDAAGALQQWRELLGGRAVTASWMPPTFALVMWTLGRQDEAVAWYAAAVRSEPARWSSPDGHAVLLPDWKPAELEVLGQVQQAWQENPPAWP